MSLVASFLGPGPSGFGYGSTSDDVTKGRDLSGQTFVVTGVTSGLGRETARVLLERSARVFALGRSVEAVTSSLAGLGAAGLIPVPVDLADLGSVAGAARTILSKGVPLQALVLNAGVMAVPSLELVQGYERQFFTNHIGHFYLTRLLVDALGPRGRVVVVSSDAHRAAPRGGIDFDNLRGEQSYHPWVAYGRSKLANLLFAFELGARLRSRGQIAHAVHPGVIDTPLNRHMPVYLRTLYPAFGWLFMKTVPQGAATQLYVATHPAVPYDEPKYWADSNPRKPRAVAEERALQRRLWEVSERIIQDLGADPLPDLEG